MKNIPAFPARRSLFLTGLVGLAATCSLHAQTWDSEGGNNNWSTGANWSANVAPVNNSTANVAFGTGAKTTPNVDVLWSINMLTFNVGVSAFMLGGQPLTIGAGGIVNTSFNTQTINNNLTVGAAQTWSAGLGNLTIGTAGSLLINNGNLLTIDGSNTTSINSAISGAGGLTKNGAGTFFIGGAAANSFSGPTTVNAGMLQLSKATGGGGGGDSAVTGNLVIGDGAGGANADVVSVTGNYQIKDTTSVTINSSGLLGIGNAVTDDFAALTMNGGNVQTGTGILRMLGAGSITATSTVGSTATISGNLDLNGPVRSFTVNDGFEATDLSITAVVSNGGISKNGAGVLSLAAANSFAGGFNLNGGTVIAGHNSALGSGALFIPLAVTLVPGGGPRTFANAVTIEGSLTTGGSAFSTTFTGPVTMAGDSTINTQTPAEFSGAITQNGNHTLSKNGSSTLTLSGAGMNAIHTTNVNTGTLILNKTGSDFAIRSVTIGDGIGGANADVVRLNNSHQIGAGYLLINSSGLLDLNGFEDIVPGVTLDGAHIQTGAGHLILESYSGIVAMANALTSTIEGNVTLSTNFDVTNFLSVDDFFGIPLELDIPANIGGGSAGLIKAGTGKVRLSGNNTFTGGFDLQDGTVVVGSNTAFGSDSLFLSAGTLQSDTAGIAVTNPTLLSGNIAVSGTAPLTFDGPFSVNSAIASLNIGNTLTITTPVTDTVGSVFTKSGAGTLALNAATTFDGPLLLTGGTLTAPSLSTSGTGAFTQSTGTAFNGTLTSYGSFTYNGGSFNGRLINHGSASLNASFTAGNGIANYSALPIPAGRFIAANGAGLDNQGGIALGGGTLTGAGPLVNNGLIAGSGTISGSGGFLNNAQLAATGNLTLANSAANTNAGNVDVLAGVQLRLTGANLSNTGSLNLAAGIVTGTATLNNNPGGLVTGRGLIATSFANAGGTVQPQGGTLTIASAFANSGVINLTAGSALTGGVITNTGSIQGDGTIANVVNNSPGGEVRAQFSKSLYFTGATGANSGRVNLQGGMIAFAQPHTLASAGQINGAGVLAVPASPAPSSGSPAAGLNVSGQVNLAGGDSLLFGTIAMNAGSRLIASGGATATFFDIFRHNGTEVKASAASSLVFFAEVRGAGGFTGSGTIYMEGGYSPGNSAASVSLAPQIVFTSSNTLTLEIGGPTAGAEHDKLTFTHAAAPQVTWGGTLAVTLTNGFTPAAGDSFDVFDFTRAAGTFATLNLPTLPAGLTWDTAELYTTGIIRVVPGGLTFSEWAATVLGDPAATSGGDHDHDGYDNATEFALGLFPAAPGTVEPDGGFFTYVEGERLRLLFTRPLDRTGVTLKVQASDDLVVWTDLAISVNSAPFTGPGFVSENRAHPLSEPGLVEVRDLLNAASTPRRQMRLLILLTP